jgi:hypothetical protein
VQELAVVFAGIKQGLYMTGLTLVMGYQVAEFFMLAQPMTVQGMVTQIRNDDVFLFRSGKEISSSKQLFQFLVDFGVIEGVEPVGVLYIVCVVPVHMVPVLFKEN